SKIRNLETGHAGAIDQLVRLGADRPSPGEHPRAWLDRLKAHGVLATHRQSPLFTYCFELTRDARRNRARPCPDWPIRAAPPRSRNIFSPPTPQIADPGVTRS
ncbi:hypothetical protein LXJ56_24990, partial [Escherichia coli]|nr:hypothetical protein [Escherichia coli]